MKSRSKLGRVLPAIIALANMERAPVASAFDSGDIKPGAIYALANDSRFVEGNFSEPLTRMAIGYRDPNNIEATLEFFAPKVTVSSQLFEWKKWSNAEEFYSESDDIRAIGSDFKRVEYTGQDQTGKTYNKGLMMRVDLDQVKNVPNWQNDRVAKLIRRLQRNELRRAFGGLSAAATNTGKVWDVAGTADADGDVASLLTTTGDVLGFMPNRIGYGHSAWLYRFLSLRGNANAAKFSTAMMTPEQLAMTLGVDQVYVSKERYQTAAATKSQIVANKVLAFTATGGEDTEDPSNIKRFVSPPPNMINESGFQRPAGALDVNVYIQQISPKLVDIYVEHYSNIIITSTLGIEQFTVTQS